MSDQILNISFFLGVLLLIVSIILLRSSQRKKFDNTPQIIQLWGLKLEVSILTLVFLISVGLIAINIWYQLQRINEQIQKINAEKEDAREQAKIAKLDLERATNKEYVAFISLSDVSNVSQLNFKTLSCNYRTKAGTPGKADVTEGASNETLQITFKNLSSETIIDYLELIDTNDKTGARIWSGNVEFQPLKPHTFRLTKVN
ncbi:MAG TPA: hypothetical protein VLA93_06830 [Pyrinomonadaceae bacterium]|nr:hypothetical protein [Pyrinomonadaceae bacterium]